MSTMENLMAGRHLFMKTGLFEALSCGEAHFRGEGRGEPQEESGRDHRSPDLQAVRNKFVGGLPYGIQKQVELGRALALEPELLLLDEPCAGMNSEEKQDMIFWVKDIQDELGVTILLIEHDMKMVMDISDRSW